MGIKTGIFVNVRLESSRLPEKQLMEIDGKPCLGYLLERLMYAFRESLESGDAAIVVTSADTPRNRKLEKFIPEGVGLFFGSEKNIPLRHLEACGAFPKDRILCVEGDSIFTAVEAMEAVSLAMEKGAAFAKTTGLPIGMNSFGYTVEILRDSLTGREDEVIETGWTRIFGEDRTVVVPFDPLREYEGIRATMDYPQDFVFFRELIRKLGDRWVRASVPEIVSVIKENRLQELNGSLSEEYYRNFHEGMKREVEDGKQKD